RPTLQRSEEPEPTGPGQRKERDARQDTRTRRHRRLRDPDDRAHGRPLVGVVRGSDLRPRGRRHDPHPLPLARSGRTARAAREGSRPRTAPELREPDPTTGGPHAKEQRTMNPLNVRTLIGRSIAVAAIATL